MFKQLIAECCSMQSQQHRSTTTLLRLLKKNNSLMNGRRGIDCWDHSNNSKFFSLSFRARNDASTHNIPSSLKDVNNKNQSPIENTNKKKSSGEQVVLIKRKKVDKKVESTVIEECSFEELFESKQFQKIKPYVGTSRDENLIKEYSQFLQTYPFIRKLNNKLDEFAKKEKHDMSEPIFKKLLYFLTHIDIKYLESMNIHILRPNYHTFNITMMSYLTVGDIKAVHSLFESIPVWTENKPSYVNFVTLLTAYCRDGNLDALDELFVKFIDGKLLLQEGLDHQQAVTSVFSVIMKALMDSRRLSKVEEIYQKFLAMDLAPSPFMRNIMLSVYKIRKNYDKCIEMFEKYDERPDRHITQTMMDIYGKMGKFEEMEKLFSTIQNPNDFTYILMASAYSSGGIVSKAEEYFSRIGNRDERVIRKMMEMYATKENVQKLEELFFLIKNPTIASIYVYIDGISRFGYFEKVTEVVKLIPPEDYTGNIWACHLQSAVKTKFDNPEQYIERVHSVFFAKPKNISWKDNKFGMKLYKLALGKQFAAQKTKPDNDSLKPITEIYKEFAEKKVQLAMDGVDEGKFQTRDSFHEQFALNYNSIYRPDYVSPYESFLETYYKKKKDENDDSVE